MNYLSMVIRKKENNAQRIGLHIFALSSFAIAQPLLDIISKNVALLVARKVDTLDLLILILVLSVFIPLLLVLPGLITKLISSRLSRIVNLTMISFLAGILCLLILKNTLSLAGVASVVVAIGLGVGFGIIYSRREVVRTFCTYISPAVLIFPILFLQNVNISRIVFNLDSFVLDSSNTAKEIPVVMLVFDEMPLISLLDKNANIDRVRYPNFASFAAESHWFRNAESESGETIIAVPSMLSGILDERALPIVADYPQNLFSLLQPSHRLNVTEIVTYLCPQTMCQGDGRERIQAMSGKLQGLFSDLAVVYLHLSLPTEMRSSLPVITQSWGDFFNTDTAAFGEYVDINDLDWSGLIDTSFGKYSQFLNSIHADDETTLYFYHALLPHIPWEYLPSGKFYSISGNSIPGLDEKQELWGDNDALVIQSYQRHLLQVGFVDKLLGDLITKLKSEKLYQKSLIVIASDHGASFWPGTERRSMEFPGAERDVSGVTLLIKQPNQELGVVHDESVSTLDIVPTIARMLGIALNFRTQGRDVFSRPADTQATNPYLGNKTLQRKLDLFGSGDREGLYNIGVHRQLLGQQREEFDARVSTTLTYELDQQGYLQEVDLNAPFVPSRLTGRIHGISADSEAIDIAVALNNKIVAVAQSYMENRSVRFSVLLPDYEFVAGENIVELFRIHAGIDGQLTLETMRNPRSSQYHYVSFNGGGDGVIADQDGNTITLSAESLAGYVDRFAARDNYLEISGWAVQAEASKPVDFLLLAVDDELIYLGGPNILREDVIQAYDDPSLGVSGFSFKIAQSRLNASSAVSVKLIGVSGDDATVLNSFNYLGENDSPVLDAETYQYTSADKLEITVIAGQQRRTLTMTPDSVLGYIDSVEVKEGYVEIQGWAANIEISKAADFLLLDLNSKLYYLGGFNLTREDVGRSYNSAITDSGFSLRIAQSMLHRETPLRVNLIGVSGDEATRLKYTAKLSEQIFESLFIRD